MPVTLVSCLGLTSSDRIRDAAQTACVDDSFVTEVIAASVSLCLDGGGKRKKSNKICFFPRLFVSLQQNIINKL